MLGKLLGRPLQLALGLPAQVLLRTSASSVAEESVLGKNALVFGEWLVLAAT